MDTTSQKHRETFFLSVRKSFENQHAVSSTPSFSKLDADVSVGCAEAKSEDKTYETLNPLDLVEKEKNSDPL